VLECPDLFPMAVDGDTYDVRWVLAAGANGASEDMTTGTVYWVGQWDGSAFTAEDQEHQWLDHGADYYAAVTWDDPRLPEHERLTQRYGIGWLNNWAYAGQVPGREWQGGSDSVVRSIRLTNRSGDPTLESVPADALRDLEGPAERLGETQLESGEVVDLPPAEADAYRMTVEIGTAESDAELRIRIPRGDGAFTTVGYDGATQRVFVSRDADAIASSMPADYRTVRTAPVAPRDGRVSLDIVVDVGSVEVFANDGAAALSMVSVGAGAPGPVEAEAARGPVALTEVSIAPLRVAAVQRAH
jgi:levanase